MKKIIIFLFIILTLVAGGFYFKNELASFFQASRSKVSKDFSKLEKVNVDDLVSQVRKEVLTSKPLQVLGNKTQSILLQSKIIYQTNLQRQENGNLPALVENPILDKVASAKAADLFKNQYFDHVSPAGVGPGELSQSFGYDYIVEGENLILGNFASEKEVVQDWMNSPGHRANILNNRYTEIGVAIVKGLYKGDTVWIGVQEFGLPMSACNQPNTNLKNQIDSYKTKLNSMVSQIDEDKQQIDNTDQNSPAYRQMVDNYNQLVDQYNSLAQTVKSLVAQYNEQVNSFNNCVAGK